MLADYLKSIRILPEIPVAYLPVWPAVIPGRNIPGRDQADMIDRARAVETTLLDASRQQRRQIAEMAR